MTKRILLVEDDASHLRSIKAALESEGFIVDTATHIRAAIKLARENSFDLIVSDYMFPNFEGEQPERMGIELLRHLQDRNPKMPPFILHTSSDDKDVIEDAKEFGAIYHYKQYGVSHDALVKVVKKQLGM